MTSGPLQARGQHVVPNKRTTSAPPSVVLVKKIELRHGLEIRMDCAASHPWFFRPRSGTRSRVYEKFHDAIRYLSLLQISQPHAVQGRLLKQLVALKGARRILEIGAEPTRAQRREKEMHRNPQSAGPCRLTRACTCEERTPLVV